MGQVVDIADKLQAKAKELRQHDAIGHSADAFFLMQLFLQIESHADRAEVISLATEKVKAHRGA